MTTAPSYTLMARHSARWALPVAMVLAAAAWLIRFPFHPVLLALGLSVATALVAWRPVLLFMLIAAALPTLDLAPWSGRRFLDEFDLLLALGLAVAWARVAPASPTRRVHAPGTALALLLVLTSVVWATAHALWAWPGLDLDAFGNPMSPFNSLRVAKGAAWAAALWWMAGRLRASGEDPARAFGLGMVLGLAGTVVAVLIERLAFTYLLDFSSDYRVAGPFSAMSLGGAYVECFLAVATPFLLSRLVPPVPPWRLLIGMLLLAGASYALMVTYSRGGYGAMAVGVGVMVVSAVLPAHQRWRRAAAAATLALLTGAVAYPVLQGSFAQSRLQTVAVDLGTRERHWAESLQLMDTDWATGLIGMGIGRFAEFNFWRGSQGPKAGGHHLTADTEGQTTLRLGVGYAYFVEQILPVQPGAHYRLSYRERAAAPGAVLRVTLCQKWIISSNECANPVTPAPRRGAPAATGQWQRVTYDLTAPAAGAGRLTRPVRLSLVNEGRTTVEVTDLSLTGVDGVDLVRNGDFQAGLDHWTFTSDNHLAWHTKSLPLGIYFDQGLLGLVGFAALLLVGAANAMRAVQRGQPDGAALLAAIAAFATVGAIDTLLDAPRFLLLWLLLCLLPSTLAPAITASTAPQ